MRTCTNKLCNHTDSLTDFWSYATPFICFFELTVYTVEVLNYFLLFRFTYLFEMIDKINSFDCY